MALLATRTLTRPSARRTGVVCSARSDATSRRALLSATLLPALFYAPKALALIPDEEDEDLLEKAKANRRARLEQQRGVTREFLNAENIKDRSTDLAPVQLGIYKLAQSGSQLESGDLKAASATLSEAWVADFGRAAGAVSGADASRPVVDGLGGLQAAVSAGDLKASKQQYVAVVSALQAWASASGIASNLKGL